MTRLRLTTLPFRAMHTACSVSVTASRDDALRARRALRAGQDEVARCERVLSRFDVRSDLSRANRMAGEWVVVDGRLIEAVQAAVRGREETGGRFDPTILPAVVAAGYDRSYEQLTERDPVFPTDWRPGRRVDVAEEEARVRVEAGAALDLGAIGKGFAADRSLAAIRRAWPDVSGVIVDLGGDIAAWGASPEGGVWRVAVADARVSGATLGVLSLRRGGAATSGRDRRRFGPGRRLHHLIDPTTGVPAAGGPLAVTVFAPDAATAEVHATALAVTPLTEAREYLEAHPQIGAVLVPDAAEPMVAGTLDFEAPPSLVRIRRADARRE